ncbi:MULTISPECIES: ATP synthase subunit C [Tissierellales]|jgi:V/A-type H+-transporting ATPase subunit K|uniref:ATPase n=1 Tax=Acidilutibacter cellobiosedens TaxID=2507161 RepID=A0A410Q8C9_9FIRM|nr:MULTISPECIES: ATP synthase subunit C [Tissierellales]MBE6082384.1 ATPase [Tissierellaceae bacterium]QAT60223.1 ATPase [Acidilutibacter cellobiosedens]SCL92706.1 V-type ATP synthase subunit K [Sporanaerobacter sp. PP17-6a]
MTFILIATTIMVLMTIGAGIFLMYKKAEVSQKKLKKILRYNLFVFLPILIFSIILIVPNITNAQNTAASSPSGLGFIGAALSTGMATIGAGYAVGVVGASALGAVSEDPGILGKTLIFVGLAEGIAIYGLIVSILILGSL